jgi:DNA modification methylase
MIQKPKQLSLPLFQNENTANPPTIRLAYENDGLTSIEERIKLENAYTELLLPSDRFNRQLVSYQANKNTPIHRWMKYKEGFSAKLVKLLIEDFGIKQGQHLLDPFAGVGTSLLVAVEQGINSTGIELLPSTHFAWQVKADYKRYSLSELELIYRNLEEMPVQTSKKPFPHIPITESAFPEEQERVLMGYKEYFETNEKFGSYKNLLLMLLSSILEDISFTRKDGQYLRWDARSKKAQERDAKRLNEGKKPYKSFHKEKILTVKEAFLAAFRLLITDLRQLEAFKPYTAEQTLLNGSALKLLPEMQAQQFDAVISSPPYCNRYDYTRTYALELAFCGLSQSQIVQLRQEQLTCTVENRSKTKQLEADYHALNRSDDYHRIMRTLEEHQAFTEINLALEKRAINGELNNVGVLQMVKGYFTELAFVIYELFRLCRSGASIAFVNDNVRYAGEIIPVDLLMLDIAAKMGFEPLGIYVLPQRKGNSSQQMERYGREALRKSIIIWRKP